jgi:hypothetical protein
MGVAGASTCSSLLRRWHNYAKGELVLPQAIGFAILTYMTDARTSLPLVRSSADVHRTSSRPVQWSQGCSRAACAMRSSGIIIVYSLPCPSDASSCRVLATSMRCAADAVDPAVAHGVLAWYTGCRALRRAVSAPGPPHTPPWAPSSATLKSRGSMAAQTRRWDPRNQLDRGVETVSR